MIAGFLLTLDEARELYRWYHSPLKKLKKRLPGGKFWQELGFAVRELAANPSKDNCRPVLLALCVFLLGRRVTDKLLCFSPGRCLRPEEAPTLYHWFPAECQSSIRSKGLKPGTADGFVFMTDDPDFPDFSPYFCRKVLEAGRDIRFCPVRIGGNRLSRCQEIYRTNRPYEFAARWVPPECLDFCE